jgi:cytochrome c oxidase subunit 2
MACPVCEGGVLVAQVILLAFVSIPFWSANIDALPPQESTVVRVVAEQFACNVHHPGPDGVSGRTDMRLVSADNPLGLDRLDPRRRTTSPWSTS